MNQSGAQGLVLVYSVAQQESFTELSKVIPTLPKLPGVLIGNKLDENREVTTERGKEVAQEYGYGFAEVTSKTKEKVDEAFNGLIDKLVASTEAALLASVEEAPQKSASCIVS